MFGWLFRKKEKGVPANTHVYMTRQAAWQALLQKLQAAPRTVLVYWFQDNGDELGDFLNRNGFTSAELVHYRHVSSPQYRNQPIIFVGHHPFYSKEQAVFAGLHLQQAEVYASLEDVIFVLFGGERIATLMKRLGMSETEEVSHPMITRSIRNAQKKAEARSTQPDVTTEAEWLRLHKKD